MTQELNEKYSRFRQLIIEAVPEHKKNHPYILQLQLCPLNMFLNIIIKLPRDREEALKKILGEMDLNLEDIDKQLVVKGFQYLEMFIEISHSI